MPGPNELDPTLAALAEGQRVFGRFTLVRALGRGTLGVVWFARDEAEQRDVELKFLPEVLTRDVVAVADLKLEVERVRDLRHDVFQAIYDFHEDGPRAAVSSEFVPGNTLGALCEVRLNGCFDAAELLPWIEPLCEALTHAHRQQLVHRALHPGHLVLTPAGRVKVLDFAIAHALHEASMRHRGDESGSGTLTYASPQLAAGALPVPEDDVYSLGATLYDLLAGSVPFSDDGLVPMTQRRTMQDRWGAPIPSAWETVIASCLSKDPARRPPGVAALMQALREGMKSAPAPAPVKVEPALPKVAAPAVVEVPSASPAKPAAPSTPKVAPAKRETPPVIPPTAPISMTLPEVAAERAITVQKAHHRGALVALVCLAAAWLAARTMSERGLPPVLPEAPTAPPILAKAKPQPEPPKHEAVRPALPTPPEATPAPEPAPPVPPQPKPEPKPTTPEPIPAPVLPPQPTPEPKHATPEPMPAPVLPPQPTPEPKPATPEPIPAPAVPPQPTPEPKPATPEPMPAPVVPPQPTPPAPVPVATPPPTPPQPAPTTPPPGPRRAEPVPSSTPPKLGARWTNGIGMPFAPIPKLPVLVAIWETRARDFAAFAKATDLAWKAPADGPDFPVTNVSFLDAMIFCDWLTTTEQAEGRLKRGQRYRLPTDAEWSAAAGIPPESGATLRERDDAGDKSFPWGGAWPPPPGAGNFRGLTPEKPGANTSSIGDIYDRLAPVGSFDPTRYGVFDLAGNAAEMVSDFIAPELGLHATRGGSFRDDTENALRLRARGVGETDRGTAPYIGFRIVLDPSAKN